MHERNESCQPVGRAVAWQMLISGVDIVSVALKVDALVVALFEPAFESKAEGTELAVDLGGLALSVVVMNEQDLDNQMPGPAQRLFAAANQLALLPLDIDFHQIDNVRERRANIIERADLDL